jgi:uncharacterized protein
MSRRTYAPPVGFAEPRTRYKATTSPCAGVYTLVCSPVRFTWDSGKSERNLAERGFDFAFAASAFAGPTLERIDTRQDYGEVRRIALGVADEIPLTIVYTDRAEAGDVVRRIISARVSNRRERQAYRKVFPS